MAGSMGAIDSNYDLESSESYLELEEKDFTDTSVNNKVNVSLDSLTAVTLHV